MRSPAHHYMSQPHGHRRVRSGRLNTMVSDESLATELDCCLKRTEFDRIVKRVLLASPDGQRKPRFQKDAALRYRSDEKRSSGL